MTLTTTRVLALVAAALCFGAVSASADAGPEPEKKQSGESPIEAQVETPDGQEAPVCDAPLEDELPQNALARAQDQIREARKAQLERWERNGWTATEAAEAGETVVLNSKGYNYASDLPPPAK